MGDTVNSNWEKRDVEFILNRLSDTLKGIWVECQQLDELGLNEVSVIACDIRTNVEEYLAYTHTYKEIQNKTKEENIELKDEIKELKAQIKVIKTLEESIKTIKDNTELITKIRDRQKKMITQGTGEKAIRFIKDLDTLELVQRYKDNGYSITKEMLEEYRIKYNITYNGLRNRLINAGVWQSRPHKEQ